LGSPMAGQVKSKANGWEAFLKANPGRVR
jgi:hypothetical protein